MLRARRRPPARTRSDTCPSTSEITTAQIDSGHQSGAHDTKKLRDPGATLSVAWVARSLRVGEQNSASPADGGIQCAASRATGRRNLPHSRPGSTSPRRGRTRLARRPRGAEGEVMDVQLPERPHRTLTPSLFSLDGEYITRPGSSRGPEHVRCPPAQSSEPSDACVSYRSKNTGPLTAPAATKVGFVVWRRPERPAGRTRRDPDDHGRLDAAPPPHAEVGPAARPSFPFVLFSVP